MIPTGDAVTLDTHIKKIAMHKGAIEHILRHVLACLEAWLPGKTPIS